ncbi:ABC transporter permease [Paenibacillus sp. oral taxon 786]|uniref:ABC transporter permease n=1 Tax=Paenibacillus sp. oral taxon 786 TaxID=652715 RepID=UPI0002E10D1C|nr:ABC transporter permease subunit [Paenibacillus sp. oral taxon 786]
MLARWKRYYDLYLLLLPTLLYFAIFEYGPIYGLQIAFKNFLPFKGILDSPWVGFDNFQRFIENYKFWEILLNTITISIYELVLFPIPIILALLINQLTSRKFKRIVQTVTYAPHFISTVVIVGMLYLFTNPRNGIINQLLEGLGFHSIYFMAKAEWFTSIFVWSGVWQNAGWGTIIYLAALTSINPELHESAVVDGASKIKRIWHIDLPGIMPTVIVLLILSIGNFMSVGFEKVYLMQNPLNISTAEIIQTYVYKSGLLNAQYSYSAAIGMFNSVINCILLVSVNFIAKRFSQTSLW